MLLYCSKWVSVRDWESDNNNQGDYMYVDEINILLILATSATNGWDNNSQPVQWHKKWISSVTFYIIEVSDWMLTNSTYLYLHWLQEDYDHSTAFNNVLLWKQTPHMLLLLFFSLSSQ